MVDYKLIGRRIKELRSQQNISQMKLAEMTELSAPYISRIECARKKVSLDSVISIVNALGVTTDELLYGNQVFDPTEYQNDIDLLLSDCSSKEKRFLYETLKSMKQIIRENDMLDIAQR